MFCYGSTRQTLSFYFAVILCFLVPFDANAAGQTFYVDKSHSLASNSNSGSENSPWLTIQKAAETLKAGETVLVKNGTYFELVTPKNSGSLASGLITYSVFPGHKVIIDAENSHNQAFLFSGSRNTDYIKVSGFVLINAKNEGLFAANKDNITIENIEAHDNGKFGVYIIRSKNIQINNTHAHHNGVNGVRVGALSDDVTVNNCRVHDNSMGVAIFADADLVKWPIIYPSRSNEPQNITVTNCESSLNKTQGIWVQRGFKILLEKNHTHHNGATGIQIETGSREIVLDGNTSESNNTKNNGENGIWLDETIFAVVQNNKMLGNEGGLSISQSHNVIVRNNLLYNNKAQVTSTSCKFCKNSSGGISIGLGRTAHVGAPLGATNNMFVHNVLYNNGYSTSTSIWGGLRFTNNGINQASLAHDNILKNNIFANTTGKYEIYLKDHTGVFSEVNHNNYFNNKALLFNWGGANLSWAGYKSASGHDSSSITLDPLFTAPLNADFSLQKNSPAIDAGAFLTTATTSSSGKTLKVADARYFTDGFGIIEGDLIQLKGQTKTARVLSVDYASNTLVLDTSLTWKAGDRVAYSYTASAPDLGAFEQGSGADVQAPNIPAGFTLGSL